MRPMMFAVLVMALAAEAGTAPAQDGQSACMADAQKLCAGVQPGGGRILACLEKHKAKLSSACAAFVGQVGGGPASEPPPNGGDSNNASANQPSHSSP